MKRKLLFVAIALAGISQAQAVCFVNQKAMGKDDGTSWDDAYVALDSALKSPTCSEIWVAQGVYKPSGSYPFVFFGLNPGVALYGGFDGTETAVDQRDFASHVSVLSGDIDDNDAHAGTDQIDTTPDDIAGTNSPVVLMLNANDGASFLPDTIVDGFTITGAGAFEGLSCAGYDECSPTLRNLVISGNEGGGVRFTGDAPTLSTPTLSNVAFRGNRGSEGGAISAETYFGGGIALEIKESIFEGNESSGTGGAIYVSSTGSSVSALSVTRSLFSNNRAGNEGGAIYVHQNMSYGFNTTISGSTFVSNSGSKGGAVFADSKYSPATLALTNSTFADNASVVEGGAVAIELQGATGSTHTFNNVTFYGNHADGDGMTAGLGGAVYFGNSPASTDEMLSVSNSIFWNDAAGDGPEIFNDMSGGGAAISASYSVIDGGCPADTACATVYTADPMLAPLGYHWGPTPVMRPGIAGSAVNSGNDATCEPFDQRNFARPQGAHCDIGAVEMRLPSDDIVYPSGF